MAGLSSGGPAWTERAVEFGAARSLRGIVTTGGAIKETQSVFLILVNAGVIHRVGPNRLTVKLARELAPEFLPSLRFDFSGLGDSPTRTDTTSIDDAIALDMDEAMAFLKEAYSAERFLILGLCSGGREAFRAAYREPRVCGVALIDPYHYRTWYYYVKHFATRLFRASSWRTALSLGLLAIKGGSRATREGPRPAPDLAICGLPEYPAHAQMQDALDKVLARGTELLFIHTGGMHDYYSYRHQLRDAFPKQFAHERLRYEYLPGANHTFSSEDARCELIRCLSSWLSDIGFKRRSHSRVLGSGAEARPPDARSVPSVESST